MGCFDSRSDIYCKFLLIIPCVGQFVIATLNVLISIHLTNPRTLARTAETATLHGYLAYSFLQDRRYRQPICNCAVHCA